MVLTRRAYKAISRWLPNEIITEIIQATPPSDQASLCRAGKLFHALCLPLLYRVVDLKTDASVTAAFCSTIISNETIAGIVRSFTGFEGPGRLRVDLLRALVGLEGLTVNLSELHGEDFKELLRWTFPNLVQCTLWINHTDWFSTQREDTMASFLIRHPRLENICVEDWCTLVPRPSKSARIPLLQLQHLRCPVEMVPSINARALKKARIYWESLDEVVERTFVAFKSMTCPDVPFVLSNVGGDNHFKEIVNSVSRNIPHTKTLQLFLSQLHIIHDDVIRDIEKCLPIFTGLTFLSIEYMSRHRTSYNPTAPTLHDEEEARIRVISLAAACSTLEACCLHRYAWRKVAGVWEKYSLEDFKALAGISWTDHEI
ncbi:hypothetical protein B0H17DRAFT_1339176 [Mycena rosella]|uniref:Uncharacterized protein n=1 Tax=Mycena rosella TaxID=1033263 RepID=A0AAD7C9G9_MYCRO|nr:hypothetical protein B0H17DRAFT_1339176 [Mycena rosella]